MNINNLDLVIIKYCKLIKNADNMFITGFDEKNRDKIIFISKNIQDSINQLSSKFNSNFLDKKRYISQNINQIISITNDFYDMSEIFNLSNFKKNIDKLEIKLANTIMNNYNNLTDFSESKYVQNSIKKLEQTNIANNGFDLANVLFEEEQNPIQYWKQFINDVIEIFYNLSNIIDQFLIIDTNQLFVNCILALEKESKNISDKWISIFDQIEYEEKINDLDPEDLEY